VKGPAFLAAIALGFGLSASAPAQNVGAQRIAGEVGEYPETLKMAQTQGDVLLIGRIDRTGAVRDVAVLATSHEGFVDSALAAAKLWRFRPAIKDGKPIEIALNLGMRFRLQLENRRGQLPRPMVGNVDISPADASGKATAPEGFPVRKGVDPRIFADVLLDVSVNPQAHTVPLNVEAWSPGGRRAEVYSTELLIPANSTELKFTFSAAIGPEWEDGVWFLRFFVADADAGGGMFWLAKDPSKFDFAAKMPRPKAGLPN